MKKPTKKEMSEALPHIARTVVKKEVVNWKEKPKPESILDILRKGTNGA